MLEYRDIEVSRPKPAMAASGGRLGAAEMIVLPANSWDNGTEDGDDVATSANGWDDGTGDGDDVATSANGWDDGTGDDDDVSTSA